MKEKKNDLKSHMNLFQAKGNQLNLRKRRQKSYVNVIDISVSLFVLLQIE